jgi:hypothetical protein
VDTGGLVLPLRGFCGPGVKTKQKFCDPQTKNKKKTITTPRDVLSMIICDAAMWDGKPVGLLPSDT